MNNQDSKGMICPDHFKKMKVEEVDFIEIPQRKQDTRLVLFTFRCTDKDARHKARNEPAA